MFTRVQAKTTTVLLVAFLLPACALLRTPSGDWQEAQSIDTVQAYLEFSRKHPKSSYHSQANDRLMEIYVENRWQRTKSQDDVQGYEEFVKFYPKSKHVDQAKRRVAELRAELRVEGAWKTACATDTADSYRQFISAHPVSKYASVASARIEAVHAAAWNSARAWGSYNAYTNFLRAYPDTKHTDEAKAAISAALSRVRSRAWAETQEVDGDESAPELSEDEKQAKLKNLLGEYSSAIARSKMQKQAATANAMRGDNLTSDYYARRASELTGLTGKLRAQIEALGGEIPLTPEEELAKQQARLLRLETQLAARIKQNEEEIRAALGEDKY